MSRTCGHPVCSETTQVYVRFHGISQVPSSSPDLRRSSLTELRLGWVRLNGAAVAKAQRNEGFVKIEVSLCGAESTKSN